MGIFIQTQLDDKNSTRTIFCCADCHTHLFCSTSIQSDSFRGKHGLGLLVDQVVNIKRGHHEKREMMTGVFEVCDIHCQQCDRYVGWKYLKAECKDEKYKERQYVMELAEVWSPEGVQKRRSTMLNVWY